MGLNRLSFRILATVYSGLVILTGYFIYTGYNEQLIVAQQGALATLRSIGRTISLQLNGDSLEDVFNTYPFDSFDTVSFSSPVLERMIDQLKQAQDMNALTTPIYTVTYDSVARNFHIGAASNGYGPYGFLYESHPPSLLSAYYDGGTVPPYTDDHGTWLSALTPVRNQQGNVVAAVEVDYPLDHFIAYARTDSIRNLCLSLLLFLIIGGLLYPVLRKILKAEVALKTAVLHAHRLLQVKNEEIGSSLEYARTIQMNVYPEPEMMNAFFDDFMVFNRPLNVVSGDFYWFLPLGEGRALVAVADCTGHGVPGALMSIMGNNYLDEAVFELKLDRPSDILNCLDKRISRIFKNDGNGLKRSDGMDLGICLIDKANGNITFSGARRPLVMVGKDGVTKIDGVRRGIGEQFLADRISFEDVTVPISKENTYFLYSDGLQDQFGGEASRKLMRKRLLTWLESIAGLSADKQHQMLSDNLSEWMGNNPQVDDICLLAFSVQPSYSRS